MRVRFKHTAIFGALLLALAPACGDDDGTPSADAANNNADAANNTADAPLPSADASICANDLSPIADGTDVTADLVMSEISPGNHIELYNSTTSAIALSGVAHQLCSPFAYRSLSAIAPTVTVPPKGFAVIPWPSSFTDVAAGGEVILYKDGSFTNGESILDFVCWGTNPHGSRKALAEEALVGKWGGACAAAITGGSIHRNMNSAGTGSGDYDVASPQSPVNCVQP